MSYVLNEGALISDSGSENEMFNKYFPAFLLALNQREVFKFRTELICSSVTKGADFLNKNAEKLLEDLKYARIQQELHYISDVSEVMSFYKELHRVFYLESLIKDVTETTEALHGLKEIKNNKRLNRGLLIIGLLSIFSATNDGMDLFFLKETHWEIKIIVLSLIFLLILIFQSSKKDWIENLRSFFAPTN